MSTTSDTYGARLVLARELGADAGRAAASWYFDGNTEHGTYVRVYRGIRDDDDQVLETFPHSPLSGEWADAPLPADILRELDAEDDEDGADDYLFAYESAYCDAAYEEISRVARLQVHNHGAYRAKMHAPIAYTWDADHHCAECTAEAFGVDEWGDILPEAEDSEGNQIGAVAPWDEWYNIGEGNQTLACGTCGAELAEYEDDDEDDDEDDEDDVRELARRMSRRFTRRTRLDGTTFTTLVEDADEWMRDVVRGAHGDMLPDDWRYDVIASAVEFIADNEDYDDRADEWADGCVDVYSAALGEWLSSHGARAGYVQEARDEFGDAGEDVWDELRRGQYLEAREVWGMVFSGLEDASAAI